MTKILFVEDDDALGTAIKFSLEDEGFEVMKASTVQEAKHQFGHSMFDLAILDIGLPDGNGYDLCRYLKSKRDIPIIFLTALDEEVNVVMGLDIGGDDYITKPFRVKELVSRVKVQLRKRKPNVLHPVIECENIRMDLVATKVYKQERTLALTHLEYKLLSTFMMNAHRTLKREEILAQITEDMDAFFDENTLSVYIKRLREKIEDNPKNPQFIVTQRGMGYRWDKDVNQK